MNPDVNDNINFDTTHQIKNFIDYDNYTKDAIMAAEPFCNDISEKYKIFCLAHNIDDTDDNDNNDKVEILTSRFNYLIQCQCKSVYKFDQLSMIKYNYFCELMNKVRLRAIQCNLEKEVSINITNLCIIPMNLLNIKHNQHYYDYLNNFYEMERLYMEIDFFEPEFAKLLHPKQLMILYDSHDDLMLQTLMYVNKFLSSCEETIMSQHLKSIDTYVNTFNITYSRLFCRDYTIIIYLSSKYLKNDENGNEYFDMYEIKKEFEILSSVEIDDDNHDHHSNINKIFDNIIKNSPKKEIKYIKRKSLRKRNLFRKSK